MYKPDSEQDAIFEDVSPLIHSCVDGYNVCIFAYGQTGSGKTYTMEGTQTAPGVIYQTFSELFRLKQQVLSESGSDSMKVWLSCLEIYNEKIRDLLPDKSRDAKDSGVNPADLKAKLSKCGKKVLVPGLTKVEVVDTRNVRDILVNTAYRNRSTGTTNMNEHSSRSHALVFVEVVTLKSSSRLVLIDLAGSERVKKTGASGDRFNEARNINKSLSALGNVISSLQRKDKHIPYRDSQLTYLLHDCLGGNSKALMFCNISCELFDVKESINTLQFANRVRRVQLGEAVKNESSSSPTEREQQKSSGGGGDSAAMKQKVKRMKKELEDKEKEINHLKMNNRNCKKEISKLTSSMDAVSSKKANHHQTRMDYSNLQKEHSRTLQDIDKKEKQIKKLRDEVHEYKHKLKSQHSSRGHGHSASSHSQQSGHHSNRQIERPRTAMPALSTTRSRTAVNPRKRKMMDQSGGADPAMQTEHQPALKRRKVVNPQKHSRNGIKKPTVSRANLKRTRSARELQGGPVAGGGAGGGAVPSYMQPTRNGRAKERKRGGYHGTRARSISLESNGNAPSSNAAKKAPTKKKRKTRERNLSLDSVTSMMAENEREAAMAEEAATDIATNTANVAPESMIMDESDASDEQKEDTTAATSMKAVLKPTAQSAAGLAPFTPSTALQALKIGKTGKSRAAGAENANPNHSAKNRKPKRAGSKSGGGRQNKEHKRKPFGAKPFTVSSLAMQNSRK